ncbi:MAG: hypothetical protein J6I32_06635, partial [Bacteroidaceae bacterium]|nr:hypothetical protein [Bacteroidaceae bacterium]
GTLFERRSQGPEKHPVSALTNKLFEVYAKKLSPTEAATSALRDEVPRRLGAKKRREVTKPNFFRKKK